MSSTRTTDLYFCERRHIQRKSILRTRSKKGVYKTVAHKCDICGGIMKPTARKVG